jgi:hypothetical protein
MVLCPLASGRAMTVHMPEGVDLTHFYVAIDYRTQRELGFWSDIIPAISAEEARESAEKLLRRKRRTVARIDRIVVM